MVTTTIPTAFIVRHGERLDHIDKLWQPDPSHGIWDPPLTPQGFKQAELTGNEIMKMIRKQDIKNPNIIVYSSPFQRCIDTSIGIAKGLQQQQKFITSPPMLRLDIGLGEWMCERFYDYVCPAQHILSRQQENLARQQAYSYSMLAKKKQQQQQVVEEDDDNLLPPLTIDYAYSNNAIQEFDYPERYTDMIHRFEETRLICLESASRTKLKKTTSAEDEQQQQQQQQIVVIFVTHAVGVNALLDGFRDRVTIPLESNYCSISCVRHYNSSNTSVTELSDQSDEDCEFTEEGGFHSPKSKWIIDTVMYDRHLTL